VNRDNKIEVVRQRARLRRLTQLAHVNFTTASLLQQDVLSANPNPLVRRKVQTEAPRRRHGNQVFARTAADARDNVCTS